MHDTEGNNSGRTMMGFFISPLLGMIAGAIVLFFQHPEGFSWLDGRISRFQGATTYVMIFGLYAYIGMLTIGLPLHWLLRRLRFQPVWLYFLLGPVAALLFVMGLTIVLNLPSFKFVFIPFLFGLMHPTIVGAVTFTAFWFIAVRRHKHVQETT